MSETEDYFDALGVKRDATDEELRAAFRRKAKATHPDRKGGDNMQMVLVNRAYETLKDPERRKAYEQTGQDRPANFVSAAREMLVAKFMLFMVSEDSGDMINFAMARIMEEKNKHRANLVEGKKAVSLLQKRIKKLKFKGRGTDFIRLAVEFEIQKVQHQVNIVQQTIDKLNCALEMAKDYEFESESDAGGYSPKVHADPHVKELYDLLAAQMKKSFY